MSVAVPDWQRILAQADAYEASRRASATPAAVAHDPLQSFGTSISYGFNASNIDATAFIARLGTALAKPFVRLSYPGATMSGGPEGQVSILAQMRSIPPPGPASICVMEVGTNDAVAFDKDPLAVDGAVFSADLQQGLLEVTSNRRIANPQVPRDALLNRFENYGTVPGGCTVFVGTAPPQSTEYGAAWVSGANARPNTLLYFRNLTNNAVVAVAARGRRVFLVDLATAFNPITQSTDGIHPDDAGHLLVSQLFYARMRAVGV